MSTLAWLALGLGLVLVLLFAGVVYLAVILAWEDQRTRGSAYYGLPLAQRDRFRSRLRRHARLLHPIISVWSRLTKVKLPDASFRYEGIAGPKGSCSEESFRSGHTYHPRPEDVFVVTQMKSGTTWMQHLVYQVLTRGEGDLAETGTALYAVAPWLEGVKSVSMEEAPLIGIERQSRLIKTHFPVSLCPRSSEARYIYVVRHPASCFASCVDFVSANLGAFAPGLDEIHRWFCSDDDMWWGAWPLHVNGWWKEAQERSNVLFVRFGEMRRDLTDVARRVADFLGITPLIDAELASIMHKCSFEYMQRHSRSFEMQPPHLLAVDAELFVKGTSDRYKDVPEDLRNGIIEWCAERLSEGDFPLAQEYPD